MSVSTRGERSGDEGQAESRTEGNLLGLLGGLIQTGDLGSLAGDHRPILQKRIFPGRYTMRERSLWVVLFAAAFGLVLAFASLTTGPPAQVDAALPPQAPPPVPTTVTLYATEDSYVDDGMANTN